MHTLIPYWIEDDCTLNDPDHVYLDQVLASLCGRTYGELEEWHIVRNVDRGDATETHLINGLSVRVSYPGNDAVYGPDPQQGYEELARPLLNPSVLKVLDDPIYVPLANGLSQQSNEALQRVLDAPLNKWNPMAYCDRLGHRCLVGHLGNYRYAPSNADVVYDFEPGYSPFSPANYHTHNLSFNFILNTTTHTTPNVVRAVQHTARCLLAGRTSAVDIPTVYNPMVDSCVPTTEVF
jgi:hypothetical protein